MVENTPKIVNISMEKGVRVLKQMFLGQTHLLLTSWNKNFQTWHIWGI